MESIRLGCSIRVFQKNRKTNRINCLAGWNWLMQDCGGWHVQNQQYRRLVCLRARRAAGADEVWKQSAGEFLLPGEVSLFVLFRLSTDWLRPTYVMEGHLLYPEFTNLSVHLIQQILPKLTSNINNYRIVYHFKNSHETSTFEIFLNKWGTQAQIHNLTKVTL